MEAFGLNSYGYKASQDLKRGEGMMRLALAQTDDRDKLTMNEGALMFFQQSLEKYFKQVLIDNGADMMDPMLLGHKVLKLAKHAGYSPTESERYLLLDLGNDYTSRRYPVADKDEEPTEATSDLVKEVHEVCLSAKTFAEDNRRSTAKAALHKLRL